MILPTVLLILAALCAIGAIRALLNTVFKVNAFGGRSRARSLRDMVLYLALTTLMITAASMTR
ncbi:hypothetical protein [Roseibium alexandrii]|uniref:Uncharacterized protein n=1 Tax=Roseibium alexandrii TaxID=388408 RepID=A0A0M6ZWH0_9HYPH|nr:hypothetical protein [Roseibium alexandrii]CTQ67119.1 hypothetical protein LAX5112_01220 [Roseibium alexandrii]